MNLQDSNKDNNPFGIPEGYFEGFEASIEARLAEEELREIVNTPGFTIPADYLSSVEDSVLEQLPKPETKVISLFSRKTLYAAVGVAAAVALAITIFNKPAITELDFAGIDTETLEEYIASDAIAFSDADLLDFVSEEDIENSLLDDQDISDETIESYLLENLDDLDLITTY